MCSCLWNICMFIVWFNCKYFQKLSKSTLLIRQIFRFNKEWQSQISTNLLHCIFVCIAKWWILRIQKSVYEWKELIRHQRACPRLGNITLTKKNLKGNPFPKLIYQSMNSNKPYYFYWDYPSPIRFVIPKNKSMLNAIKITYTSKLQPSYKTFDHNFHVNYIII